MSTRSYICKENEDGTIIGVYCHSDGYLTYNGAMLIDHYSTRDRVDKLLEGGSLSSLGPKIEPDPTKPHGFDFDKQQEGVCVFYGRDRGEDDYSAQKVDLKELNKPESWIDYCYIYGKDNVWRYFVCGNLDGGLRTVQEGLDEKYKSLGFSRPADYYGFFTEQSIQHFKSLEQSKSSGTDEEME